MTSSNKTMVGNFQGKQLESLISQQHPVDLKQEIDSVFLNAQVTVFQKNKRETLSLESTLTPKQVRKHSRVCHKIQPADKDNRRESLQNLHDKVENSKVTLLGAKATVSNQEAKTKLNKEMSCLNKEHSVSQLLQSLGIQC